MNIANKLTIFRVILVPVFMVFLLADKIPNNFLWALIIFAAASLTDFIDGQIARRRHMITDFGKFLDPLADKVLVVSALVCFVGLGLTESWVVVLIIAREFLVTSLRLVASSGKEKLVIAASIWGKLKTVLQMAAIVLILAIKAFGWDIMVFGNALMYAACAATVISGIQYMWDYRRFIDVKK